MCGRPLKIMGRLVRNKGFTLLMRKTVQIQASCL
jgi:hypothetical protein